MAPEAPVIPFFFSEPSYRVAARAGDEARASDGTLLHRHTYVDGDDGGWPPSVPFFLLVLAGAATVGVFAWWGRRSTGGLAS